MNHHTQDSDLIGLARMLGWSVMLGCTLGAVFSAVHFIT